MENEKRKARRELPQRTLRKSTECTEKRSRIAQARTYAPLVGNYTAWKSALREREGVC
jgi:hypothetical protein